MVVDICGSSRATCASMLCILFICGAITLFLTGSIQHSTEYPKVLSYKKANCTILNILHIRLSCPMNSIASKCIKTLLVVMFYDGKALVTANIDDSEGYYETDSSHQCWYDTRDSSKVQLNEPSTRVAIILLSCGGCLILLSLIICMYLRWHFIKKKRDTRSENYIMVLYTLT